MTLHFAGGLLQSAILFQIALGLRYVQTCPFVFGASKKFYVKKQKMIHILYTPYYLYTHHIIYITYIYVCFYIYINNMYIYIINICVCVRMGREGIIM